MSLLPNERGFVELLRMESGVVMPLHRNIGEIHAYLSGSRQLCTVEIVGAGDYVCELIGNTDSWKTFGKETMLAFSSLARSSFSMPRGRVIAMTDAAAWQLAELERHCFRTGLSMPELNN